MPPMAAQASSGADHGAGHGHGRGHGGGDGGYDTPNAGYLWLAMCFLGIMCSFIVYGIVMEYATSGGRELHELSMIFLTSLMYSVTAWYGRRMNGEVRLRTVWLGMGGGNRVGGAHREAERESKWRGCWRADVLSERLHTCVKKWVILSAFGTITLCAFPSSLPERDEIKRSAAGGQCSGRARLPSRGCKTLRAYFFCPLLPPELGCRCMLQSPCCVQERQESKSLVFPTCEGRRRRTLGRHQRSA